MISLPKLLKTAVEVQSTQEKLLQLFFIENPRLKDFKFQTDFPKSGAVSVGDEIWCYTKHGLGYRFSSEHGVVIDVHNDFNKGSSLIDAHRLTEYLLSTGMPSNESDDLYAAIESGLSKLQAQGLLKRVETQPLSWQLARPGR